MENLSGAFDYQEWYWLIDHDQEFQREQEERLTKQTEPEPDTNQIIFKPF